MRYGFWFALLLLVGGLLAWSPAEAAGPPPDSCPAPGCTGSAQAKQYAQARSDYYQSFEDAAGTGIKFTVYNVADYFGDGKSGAWVSARINSGGGYDMRNAYIYPLPTPALCAARPNMSGWIKTGTDATSGTSCNDGCEYYLSDGQSSGDGKGHNVATGTFTPTGAVCPAGGATEIGGGPGSPAPPKVCNGVSCYDPINNTACAVVDGTQVCVSGSGPGGDPPKGCATAGNVSLCAGAPPPSPPNPPIFDPPTQIAGTGNITTQKTAPNSPITNTTTNIFNGGTSPTSNGAKDGDVGSSEKTTGSPNGDPAGSSSTGEPGDPTKASGGGDCNTPPICTGDNATCAAVQQLWLGRCKGDGEPSNDADKEVPGLEGISDGVPDGMFTQATLLDKLDASGFGGGGVCPAFPSINIPMFHVESGESAPVWWCDILGAAGKVFLLIGAFVSLRILAGN